MDTRKLLAIIFAGTYCGAILINMFVGGFIPTELTMMVTSIVSMYFGYKIGAEIPQQVVKKEEKEEVTINRADMRGE